MSDPFITVITVVRDEETMLPFFFRHYGQFADRFIVFDNGSSDLTCDLVRAEPKAKLHFLDTKNVFKDSALMHVKNQMYQFEPGTWFIIVDCDEFVWHPDIVGYLKKCEEAGVTIPRTTAYDMIGTEVPKVDQRQLWQMIDSGVRNKFYDKSAVVHKDVQINYRAGCHHCKPSGRVKFSHDESLKLLHFAWLSEEYRINRAAETVKRLSDENKANGWSAHYMDLDKLRAYYQKALKERKPLDLKGTV